MNTHQSDPPQSVGAQQADGLPCFAPSRVSPSRPIGFDPSRIGDLLRRASPLPWCWEQCGEKCDDPVIGIAHRFNDESLTQISGYLEDFDTEGNPIEYYRESIAYLGDANSPDASPSANAMLIVEAINALPKLLELAAIAMDRVETVKQGSIRRTTARPEGIAHD